MLGIGTLNSIQVNKKDNSKLSQSSYQGSLIKNGDVHFGAKKLEPTKECINLAKDAFVKLDKFDGVEIDEKEMKSFGKAAKSIFDKIQNKLGTLQEAKLPNRSVKVGNIGDTEVHAYSLWGGYYFEQHSKGDEKALKGLEIVPSLKRVRIYSSVDDDSNLLVKSAKKVLDLNDNHVGVDYNKYPKDKVKVITKSIDYNY